ncbi:MAG: mannose-1-phosphate guanylyltransferase [Odoribacteraceae bacterium]|jgi:mannose-1-phosphate guanylyltransferase|nr:mannose-1-phosphate guanylyltransferase [Odoribacteraceae bacterium]
MNTNTYCVIMAGGSGKRLWPVSSKSCPKQFRDVTRAGKSLLQLTFERAARLFPPRNILVVTGAAYAGITREQLPTLPGENLLEEPFGRNTAPCIAYAAHRIARVAPDATMVVVPSDHFIADDEAYNGNIQRGVDFVTRHDGLLTIGISPTRPETGYGYIQLERSEPVDGVYRVKTFTEKPDEALALAFLRSGDFLWNAGIFIWRVRGIIEEFARHLEDVYRLFQDEYLHATNPDAPENIERLYSRCPSISVDFGIMEHAERVHVIKGDFGWSDVGTWHAFHDISEKDERGNVPRDGVLFLDSSGCTVDLPRDVRVVVAGVNDCIIAGRDDVLMVCARDRGGDVRHFEEMLRQRESLRDEEQSR